LTGTKAPFDKCKGDHVENKVKIIVLMSFLPHIKLHNFLKAPRISVRLSSERNSRKTNKVNHVYSMLA